MMDKKSFIFTSRRIFDKNTKNYHDIILDTIQNGGRINGSPAKIKCGTRFEDQIVFIYVEIVADSSVDAAAIVRRKLNTLFQDAELFPSAAHSSPRDCERQECLN